MVSNKNKGANKFVVSNKDIFKAGKLLVEKNDVGIIRSGSDKIFFVRIWDDIDLDSKDFSFFDINNVGDGFSKKICNICHKLLETNNFAKNQNGINNRTVRRPSCRKCREKIEGVNIRNSEKKEWLKNKPVMVPFTCPICSKRTIAGVTSKIVLDHNHLNGNIRAWVCDSCNTGIGRFKDNIDILKRAIKFIS